MTHSSGNHAAALTLAARQRGIKAYIVMPRTAPPVKKKAVEEYGAEIIFCEPTLQAREENLEKVINQTQAILLKHQNIARNKKIGIILSRGNVDLDNLPW